MAAPTVASLCRALGAHLSPAPGFTAPAREITAVHLSELLDPTGYLTGGELLLTTGLTLPKNRIGCQRYVARLAEAELTALAIGLGPVHAEVPAPLIEACSKLDLPLLVVPAPTPFLRITKAYWAAVSRSAEQELKDVVATQRALVDAAASADPVGGVLRTLSRSLDAWSATFSPSGEVEQVHPPGLADEAEQARREILRLEGAGVHSAASFSTGSTAVIVFPLTAEERVAGYLAVGTSAPLDPTRRRAVLTASALLSLDAVRRVRAQSVAEESQRCVGLLVDLGFVDAARRLAAVVRAPSPTDHVRVLALRSRHRDLVASTVRRWCHDTIAAMDGGDSAWFLVPSAHPPLHRLDARLATADPDAVAVVSDVVPVEQASIVRGALTSTVAQLTAGTRRLDVRRAAPDGGELADRLGEAVDRLSRPQLEALVVFLRHHGQWEPASRGLGVHRNTLRHRIARCRSVLTLDLDDPDVTAELWLLLRRRGLA